MKLAKTVSLIGSFRKYYDEFVRIKKIFEDRGIFVTSPSGAPITPETREKLFVRLESDSMHYSNAEIQSITLKKILNSSCVYVVCPDGYIGRTTCYEIGRVIQAKKAIYFQYEVNDLPIFIPKSHILSPEELVRRLLTDSVKWIYDFEVGRNIQIEQLLVK